MILFLQAFSYWNFKHFQGYPSTMDPITEWGQDGNKPGQDVYREVTDLGIGGFRTLVTTPMVRKHVRQFFNCTTMQGAELEDDTDKRDGVAEWDQRIFEVGSK
jgi:hypothetical protein